MTLDLDTLSTSALRGSTHRIVVGVADTPEADAALKYAAAEATRRGLELHLVRVWRDVDWFLSAPPSALPDLADEHFAEREFLLAARARARELAPHIDVTADFVPGSIYAVLLEISRTADALVLGAAHTRSARPPRPAPDGHGADRHDAADGNGTANGAPVGPRPATPFSIGLIAQWYLDHSRCPVAVVDATGRVVAGDFVRGAPVAV